MSISWPPPAPVELQLLPQCPTGGILQNKPASVGQQGASQSKALICFPFFINFPFLVSDVIGWSSFYSSITLCLGLRDLSHRGHLIPIGGLKLGIKFLDFKKEKLLRSKYTIDVPLGSYVRKEQILQCCCNPVLVAPWVWMHQCPSCQERISHGTKHWEVTTCISPWAPTWTL